MVRWWGVLIWLALIPLTHTLTLDDYFKLLALVAKKRDMWRKIFLGNDIGFEMSPWLFKDRVKPPYVPLVNTFPRYPVHGHYRNERAPPQPLVYYAPPVSPPPVHIPALTTPPPTYHLPTSNRREPRKSHHHHHYRLSYPLVLKHPHRPLRKMGRRPRVVFSWG